MGANRDHRRTERMIIITVWSALLLLSFGWNYYSTSENINETALIEARALFNKDKAFRFWAAKHGGVYVPVTEETPQNPFLSHLKERDIKTPSGKTLTLMNPAYMLREMMTEFETTYGIKGHITSLVYFRPETAPDNWERHALQKFEKGVNEVVELAKIDNRPFLRLMQPLYAKKSCLKCHGFQGYKEGDLRGGVSLSVPLENYIKEFRNTVLGLAVTHALIWLSGLLFLYRFRGGDSAIGKRG